MIRAILPLLAAGVLAILLSGCDESPGRPKLGAEVTRPQDQLDFTSLYQTNCAGCHGENGKNGAAIDLANPDYQSLVDDKSLKKWITDGMPGTEMPAFTTAAGGSLTGNQIDSLVAGMRKNWAQSNVSSDRTSDGTENLNRPAYLQAEPGDSSHGEQIYASTCVSCHRPSSQQITNPAYLALVSDQALRSIVIAGRPDIGHPGWRMSGPSTALSTQNVTDIVAYLASLRSATPGQPYLQHR